jgi:hypothetical protein
MAFLSWAVHHDIEIKSLQALGVSAENEVDPLVQDIRKLAGLFIDITEKSYVFASYFTWLLEMSEHYIHECDLDQGQLDGETGFISLDMSLYWDMLNNHRFPESDMHVRIIRVLDAVRKINPPAYDEVRDKVQADIGFLRSAFAPAFSEYDDIIEVMTNWSENAVVDPAVLVERLQVAAICGVNAYGHWARLGGFEIPLAIPVLECYHDACDNYTRMVSALIYNERAIAVMS